MCVLYEIYESTQCVSVMIPGVQQCAGHLLGPFAFAHAVGCGPAFQPSAVCFSAVVGAVAFYCCVRCVLTRGSSITLSPLLCCGWVVANADFLATIIV